MFMSKVYQPIVIESCEKFIGALIETEFFKEHEIEDLTFARKHLCDILTEKFINGDLDQYEPYFTDVEFEQILRELVAGSVLEELKKKGLIDSYEDDVTEEMFFLTNKGKKLLKETGGNISEFEDLPE